MKESELTEEALSAEIQKLASDADALAALAPGARSLSMASASNDIVEKCLELIGFQPISGKA